MSDDAAISVYKYCTPEAAKQILTSKTLRWSSPEVFGDPFELSSTNGIDLDPDSLLDATVKLASSMLFSSAVPRGDTPLVNAIKRWRDEERFANPEEAYGILKELLGKVVTAQAEQLQNTKDKWALFVRNIRICCFCEKPDNLVAWEKYAAWHTGAVLRFTLNKNSRIPVPKHVNYVNETAQLTNIREQLSSIMYKTGDKIASRFKEQFLNKGPHHRAERELRAIASSGSAIALSNDSVAEWVDDIAFEPAELTGIYLGISSSDDLRETIDKALKSDFSQSKLYQVKKAKTGYALEVERPR